LGRSDKQLNRSGSKLRPPLADFADRVNRDRSGWGARLDLDIEPRRLVKALPQSRIVAGKRELRLAVELEHEFGLGIRGDRQTSKHRRKI
jgi:hypothetical protein